MTYEIWISEPFLREIELGKRLTTLTKLVHDYCNFRNIEVKEASKIAIVEYIIENQIHTPYLKLCTIKWALDKFTDPTNHNISAFIVFDMIKKAYQNDLHRSIIKRWDTEDEAKRIPQMTESQKEEKKKADRLFAWNIIVDLVKSGDSQFQNSNWIPAIKHLAFGIKYLPDELTQEHFNETAKDIVFAQIEADKQNPSLSKDDRTKTLKDLVLIAANKIQGTDIESRINNLRQRLICEDYIKNNV